MTNLLYRSGVVYRVCGVTPRMLDYWVTTGLVHPSARRPSKAGGRDYFLFNFKNLVRIKLIRSLRKTGVSLQRIRQALEILREEDGEDWQSVWLVSDGKDVRKLHGDGVAEALSGMDHETGQLAFSIIAVGRAVSDVHAQVDQLEEGVSAQELRQANT